MHASRMMKFRHLGSYITSEGGTERAVNERVDIARPKWRKFTEILCDANVPRRLESWIYRIIIRLTAMYASECWLVTKIDEAPVSMMEKQVLRWRPPGVHSKLCDQMAMGVAAISKKLGEKRLGWLGHERRR